LEADHVVNVTVLGALVSSPEVFIKTLSEVRQRREYLLLALVLGLLLGLGFHLFNGELFVSLEINLLFSDFLGFNERGSVGLIADKFEHLLNSATDLDPSFTAEETNISRHVLESSTNEKEVGVNFVSNVI
jgi:hypothetical protein